MKFYTTRSRAQAVATSLVTDRKKYIACVKEGWAVFCEYDAVPRGLFEKASYIFRVEDHRLIPMRWDSITSELEELLLGLRN